MAPTSKRRSPTGGLAYCRPINCQPSRRMLPRTVALMRPELMEISTVAASHEARRKAEQRKRIIFCLGLIARGRNCLTRPPFRAINTTRTPTSAITFFSVQRSLPPSWVFCELLECASNRTAEILTTCLLWLKMSRRSCHLFSGHFSTSQQLGTFTVLNEFLRVNVAQSVCGV